MTRHPFLLTCAALFTLGAVLAFWPVFLGLGLLGGAGWAVYAAAEAVRRRNARQQARREALAARADYEHWLTLIGHPAGVYGQFPPAS